MTAVEMARDPGPAFAPSKHVFGTAAVDASSRTIEPVGDEIDVGPGVTRIAIEADRVEGMAARHAQGLAAAQSHRTRWIS